MTFAIISDIHSNLEALNAVLEEIAHLPVEVIYCLGDIVGYGPDPDECVKEIFSRCRAVIRGNHDKAVAGLIDLEWFNRSPGRPPCGTGRTQALRRSKG